MSFFVTILSNTLSKIEALTLFNPIYEVLESDYKAYIAKLKAENKPLPIEATDLTDDGSSRFISKVNKYRIEIFRLANDDLKEFRRLYEDTPIIEVYELLTLKLSCNYQRPSI